MMNPKPLGVRKTVQLLVIITILAWATQTLVSQWGYGGVILAAGPSEQMSVELSEPVLELRAEATIDGSEVTLRQLCRWAKEHDDVLGPVAETVVARMSQTHPVRVVMVPEIKAVLHDRGVSLSQIHFSGAASCAVRRNEVDDATFARLLSHLNDEEPAPAPAEAVAGATTRPAGGAGAADETVRADARQTALKDLLVTDLLDRLKLPADRVQITFDPRDTATLILTSPRCRFDLDSSRATGLGAVSWEVLIRTDTTERRATLTAKALASEEQVVLARSLSKGQALRADDMTARTAWVDRPAADRATGVEQLVGQLLARDMKRGEALSAGDLKLAPLVLKDQFVTVAMKVNGQAIETVARALETGAKGDLVRAKNEATGQVYSIVVTARAAGEVRPPGTRQGVASTD